VAGTAYGVLGTVNGVGDFASSLIVGALWTSFGGVWGFAYAVIVGTLGTILMARTKGPASSPGSPINRPAERCEVNQERGLG